MKNDLSIDKNKPKWDSGLGYLILLDQEIKLANGYLINAEWAEYYRTLESWYITSIYWLEGSQKVKDLKVEEVVKDPKTGLAVKKQIDAIEKLKKLRGAANESQVGVLKKYHEMLDRLTSLAGLRLAATSAGLPGVLNTS